MMTTTEKDGKRLPIYKRLKNLLGVGLYLLCIGVLLEALTVFVRQWISFPVALTIQMQIFLTILCVLFLLLGTAWFNSTLNLIKTHFLNGENKLVTSGPFNYVRHPLYATLLIALPPLMIIWYADLLFLAPWILIIIIAHCVVLMEEWGLVKMFGEDYRAYQKYVPALLPYRGVGGKR